MLYWLTYHEVSIFSQTGCVYDGFKIIKMYKIQFKIPRKSQWEAGFTIYRRNGTTPLLVSLEKSSKLENFVFCAHVKIIILHFKL